MPEVPDTTDLPLHGARIEDYALIGDCETAALVSRAGSIDWLCWPTFSSGACFAALLGTADHGYWKIAPIAEVQENRRSYAGDTLVIETTWVTADGEVCVTDFMPPRGSHSDVVRMVRGISGAMTMRMELALRFDYGRTVPWVTHTDDGLRAIAGPDMVVLRCSTKLEGEDMTTVSEFTVNAGETQSFVLTYAPSTGGDGMDAPMPEAISAEDALADTRAYWLEWGQRNTYQGPHCDAVRRSLMVLKAMTYRPSGGIVAAVTTSLPEQLGGARNWDYRYCWLRDTSFTLMALLRAGYQDEAQAWRRWLLRATAGAPDQLQTIYGIWGERQLPEWPAAWLPGYEHSSPVLIGNAAVDQFQLDVYGEVSAALSRMPAADDAIRVSAIALQAQIVDHLCHIWEQPDDGIWETRGGRKHFTHSKVMAWVGLDAAIEQYEQAGATGNENIATWKKNRDLIHAQVCEQGFDKELNSFVQSYGSKELDASCLRIGLVGFLPMDDPRIVGTIEAIERRLMKDGFVQRYDTATSPDGLPPGEGVFLACSFWMVVCLWLIGRHDDATAMFNRLLSLANDVGLMSEEYDVAGGRLVGNFPQALTHISLVHTAFALAGMWKPDAAGTEPDH